MYSFLAPRPKSPFLRALRARKNGLLGFSTVKVRDVSIAILFRTGRYFTLTIQSFPCFFASIALTGLEKSRVFFSYFQLLNSLGNRNLIIQGCKWCDIPADFPAWQTVYTYFRNWRKDGTWKAIHDRLRGWTRAAAGRQESPSEVILDSQSVPSAPMVHQAVGFDSFKATKGRKRHTVVETLGLVMCVLVSAASLPERAGGRQVLQRLYELGDKVARLYLVWVDGGYKGAPFLEWVMDRFRWVVQVVLRPEQAEGFVLLKKRWIVERTFGWW